jgi:asparagine synthase (glutamine-hydrolysing)
MCGIAGEIRSDGRSADRALVERMTDRLASRGPDGAGIWRSGPVALGHRRLAIIDLSDRGSQPMVDDEARLVVVFNGCIYNHRELRAELELAGHRFASSSDTEVLLKGYVEWGERLVEHLAGMFAFCIVERDTGRALLARDRLGIKPLYVTEAPGALRFASTLPALLAAPDVDQRVDPVALQHYLGLHAVVPAPRTILRGVTKVPPATVVHVEPDGTRRDRVYWTPSLRPDDEARQWSRHDWEDEIEQRLRVAVRRRMIADVPVGVLLSGGLDSSLIVGLLTEEGQRDLATFSIGFDTIGAEDGDEFQWSDLVADRFATDHHRISVPTERVLDVLPDTIAAMSEPMVSHDVVAFHLLSEAVSRHVKVVQTGQGADEVFAGYHWYQTLAEAAGDGVDAYLAAFVDRDAAEVAAVVTPDHVVPRDETRAFVEHHFAALSDVTPVERALDIDTRVMLVEDPVKRVDNTTMAWGIEARVPFLDHELVELACAAPLPVKLGQGGKGVLKDIARRVVPHEVIDRPKGYFPVPPLIHLEGPYVELLRDALTSTAATERGLLRPEHVAHQLAHPNELTTLRYNKLWQIGLLELWLQSHSIG